ncbi:hypothetical protein TI05_10155 [Achromatium sp. WMS3]|nr:hypothetical protein TI05_10155 [Achromatium sp. WMS3]
MKDIGHHSDYWQRLIVYSPRPFVASVQYLRDKPGIVIWLRGHSTYQYTSNCPVTPKFNISGELVIELDFNVGKATYQKRNTIDKSIKQGWAFSHNLHYPNQK